MGVGILSDIVIVSPLIGTGIMRESKIGVGGFEVRDEVER